MADDILMSRMFNALANPERLALLREILGHSFQASRDSETYAPPTISQLAVAAEISRFSASRHLGILRDAGLIKERRDRRRAQYQLSEEGFAIIDDWLFPILVKAEASSGSCGHEVDADEALEPRR